MKKLVYLLLVGLAACGTSTAPQKEVPVEYRSDIKLLPPDSIQHQFNMLDCRSGYFVATRGDGTAYCESE